MLTRAAARKIASEKDTDTNKIDQSSSNETVSTPLNNSQERQDSDPTSTPARPSQEFKETPWTENDKLKLNALKKIYQKPYQGTHTAWTCDWKQVAREMNRRPGDCLRQHCSFAQNAWTREEDIRLLEMMDAGEQDATKITDTLYPSDDNKVKRVNDRIILLQRHQLHTMALYQGLSVDDDNSSIDLAQIIEKLHISDTDHVDPLEKALEDAKSELDRQKERLQTINKDWCNKCAYTMVERDYGIYHTYYKHDDELKKAIVNGKIEPTIETILPTVIDAYARSNGICCYCGRKMIFMEHTSTKEQAPTAASADHFIPRKMAFNSDTHLHFTCRQCNYAKSNATDAIFKSYLQDIKAFHSLPDKLSSNHIPLDDENKRQAWLTWKNFKENRRKKTLSSTSNTISQDANAAGSTKEHVDHDKVPSNDEMDDDDLLFMKMVAAMGLRDPMTGAIGVFDSTMKKSNRFIITFWNWEWNRGDEQAKKMVTGFDMQQFTSLKIQVIMKFTKDAQVEFGNIKHFYNWLEAINGAGPDSELN